MSTKIYEAWRSKIGVNLFPTLVEEIREVCSPLVKKAIKKQYKQWEDMGDAFSKEVEEWHPGFKLLTSPSKYDYSRCLKMFYGQQLTSAMRSTFDLNLGFGVRHHKKRYYIIPYVGDFYRMHKVDITKAVSKLSGLEEYAYWNNTDEPKGMNHEEWKARGKIWDELDKKWSTNYLYLDVVTFDTLYSLDPAWEIK